MEDSVLSIPMLTFSVVLLAVVCKKSLDQFVFTPNVPYLPGSRPNWLLSNILDKKAPKVYAEWEQRSQSGGVHKMLPEKRSEIYFDRSPSPMMDFYVNRFDFAIMRYDERWRASRKIFQQSLYKERMSQNEAVFVQKVNDILRGFLSHPVDRRLHGRTMSTAVTMKLMYGYDTSLSHDHLVVFAEEVVTIPGYSLPFVAAINIFPTLRYLPSCFPEAGFKKIGKKPKRATVKMKETLMQYVKKKMAEGTTIPSVVSLFLGNGEYDEMEQVMKGVALTLYGAASDTTIGVISAFTFAMVLLPEIQKQAQPQIAIYHELMRRRLPLFLGVPHAPISDEVYIGYRMPKRAIVMPNIWCVQQKKRGDTLREMAHITEKHSNSKENYPKGFFDEQGKLSDDDEILAYRFDQRRICFWKHAASSIEGLAYSCIPFWRPLTFQQAADENGKKIEIDDIFSRKTPIQCAITPRLEKAKELAEQTKNLNTEE